MIDAVKETNTSQDHQGFLEGTVSWSKAWSQLQVVGQWSSPLSVVPF